MKRKIGIGVATFALATAGAGAAMAQQVAVVPDTPDYMRAPVMAPRGAFEIDLSAGYTQGFGSIAAGVPVGRIGDAAFGAGLKLGYRASPNFAIGASGQYQAYNADDALSRGTNVNGTTVGIQADFHGMPFERLDPWVSIGTGYRMLWIAPDGPRNNEMLHGFELGKVQVGLDVRASDSVSVGPFIGASVNMFVWRNPEGPVGNVQLNDKRASTFIFAGLQGRFDVGGAREAALTRVGSR